MMSHSLGAQQDAQQGIPQPPVASLPPITQQRTAHSAIVPYTAAEWDHGLLLFRVQAKADQSPDVETFPKDSILTATSEQVATWLAALRTNAVQGLQMDPHGHLTVVSHGDATARQEFATRLAASGMSLPDKAFTLLTAVQSFADADHPERLSIAEEYQQMLDAFPVAASYWKYEGHKALASAYYLVNNRQAVVTHGTQAIACLKQVFFANRITFFMNGHNLYLSIVDALTGTPGGAAKIVALNHAVLDAAKTPPELMTPDDSTFIYMGMGYERMIRPVIALGAMLGQPAPTVRGHVWLNTANTGDHEQSLRDGIIHIVGLGTQRSSLYLLPAFSRIQHQFPTGVQALYLTKTEGYWGTAFVSPPQEIAHLRTYFTQTRPTNIPIAIWAGEKQPTRDGGSLPAPSPSIQAFKAPRLPMIAIVDGQGKIRRAFLRFTRDDEAQAVAVIQHLLAETTR